MKRFNSGVHKASADLVFARTSGKPGDADGITAFLVPMDTPGMEVLYYHWCYNMPSDHAEVKVAGVRVPHSAIVGGEGKGLAVAQNFVHQNRIRQAAQSVGVARYCVQESVKYARERKTFGKSLAQHQAIQFPLAEMHAEVEMVRNYVFKVANELDRKPTGERQRHGGDRQLPRQPARVQRRRPGDPGARRHRLHARQALRAFLPPLPPLPHHRRLGRGADPQGGGLPVRLRRTEQDREEGRGVVSDAAKRGPLTGIKVLDLASVIMGPVAAQHLADMGADVIKVEAPEGDLTRSIGPRKSQDMGAVFITCNRNKRSIVLDLKNPQSLAVLQRLVAGSDVLIHSVRTEPARKIGLDYESLRKLNERWSTAT
jgi:hypothetical protein